MIIPIFTCLDAMAAADALSGVEQNTPGPAVSETPRWHKNAILLRYSLCVVFGHPPSWTCQAQIYHFRFVTVKLPWYSIDKSTADRLEKKHSLRTSVSCQAPQIHRS